MIRLIEGLINDNCSKDPCFSDLVVILVDNLGEFRCQNRLFNRANCQKDFGFTYIEVKLEESLQFSF